MLIAVSGSQSAGKSTVLEELKKRQMTVIERKTSRSILSDWGIQLSEVNNDRKLTLKFQDEIIKRKYEDERQYIGKNFKQIIFTERTYADLFTYALISLGKDNENSEWLNEYYKKCLQYQAMTYSRVFYLNGGLFKVAHDGIRGSNHHYSKMVDLTMKEYTTQMTMPGKLTLIDVTSLDDRVEIIQQQVYHMANL